MQTQTPPSDAPAPASDLDSTAVMEVAELSNYEWILTAVTLLILFAFVSSITKWISLLRRGVRFFGEHAILPERPRARPYWNPLYFLFFFAVLIVANLQFNQLAADYLPTAPDVEVDVEAEVQPESAPPISVIQLLLSSASMVTATIVTMWLARTFRPRLRPGLLEGHERPKIGWLPARGDFALGFKAAWLILPPTMLLMGLVSVLQKYSHPVLDALKPDGPDSSPDFAVFAALFFTTAIVTPMVEEFWFRGILQGGLQRLADAMSDVRRWTTNAAPAYAGNVGLEPQPSAQDPYAPPWPANALPANTQPNPADGPGDASISQPATTAEADFATRSDWTPTAIWPIVVASLLFAIMHWGQGLAPIPLFFLSMGLGYLYRQTGSLVPSIVVHFVLNGFTMSATLLELLR